jgi:hypothetical protein
MKSVAAIFLLLAAMTANLLAQTNSVPLVNQPLVPASVPPGNKAFTLVVNGAGFSADAVLKWNGSPRVTQVLSSSSLTAKIKAADVLHFGTASVTVLNPAPGGGTSNVVYFPVRFAWSSVAMDADPNFSGAGIPVAGDFNNDGNQDVVTIESIQGGSRFSVYFGNGNGKFLSPIQTTVKKVSPLYALTADFNGDGKLDLALVEHGGKFIVFLGDGKGKFKNIPGFRGGNWYTIADLNGDGKLDLISMGFDDEDDGRVLTFFGNGDGTFQSGTQIGPFLSCSNIGYPAIGDFNGDGIPDVAFSNCNSVFVFLNNGDGTFQASGSFPITNASFSVIAADVNGDGKLDLVTDGVSVLLGKGDGTFTNDGGVSVPGGGSLDFAVVDFNGDSKPDVLIPGPQGLQILFGKGNGTFQEPLTTVAVSQFGIGDFNKDGTLDLVGAGIGSITVYWQVPLSVSPLNLAFGNENIGISSPPQTITVTNLRTFPLGVTGVTITGSDPQDYSQTNNCPPTLQPNTKCQVKVTFTPTASGTRSAGLVVAYKGLGSPQTVPLTGTGVLLGTVSLTPSQLTFATQLVNTRSPLQTATLTNTGTVAVNISSIAATSPFSETNNCPASLSVGANCQIKVAFKPTARGLVKGMLSVSDDAQGSPQTITLSGAGTVVKLSPIGVNFGNQKVGTTSLPISIALTNEDTSAPVNISGINIKGTNPGDFGQTNNCGSSVPPGGTCTIKVKFKPKATGQRSAILAVTDDGGGSPQTVPLAGTGT